MLKYVHLFLAIMLLSVISVPANGMTPSPAMIEQFKKLPKAEQERMAKQYGFDVSMLRQSTSSSTDSSKGVPETLKQKNAEKFESTLDSSSKKKSDKVERFGLRLFDDNISSFTPVSAMPVPDNYLLGADDELLIQLYGKENNDLTLKISRDGKVVLPNAGPLQVAGLTFSKASELIAERIKQTNIGVEAAVSMGQLRTINVFVAGEAKYPGAHAVSALTTVTQALFVAGGVSDIGSLRDISVNRAGKVIAQFDLYDLLLKGSNKNDIHLQHGDVVFVAPVAALVEVKGEVKRPAIYEVKSTETVSDLLIMAGGPKAGAYIKSAVLERFNRGVKTLQNLDLELSQVQKMSIQAGDVLRIDAASKEAGNQIVLAGAAARPGFYAWQPGMKLSDLLNNYWSDLLPTADLDYGLIVRENIPGTITQVMHFSPSKVINAPNSEDDLRLDARDRILLFHYANEVYEREELNDFIRESISEKLDLHQEQRWLMSDLTTKAFEAIAHEKKDKVTEFNLVDNVLVKTPSELDNSITEEEQEKLLAAELKQVFNSLYTSDEKLALSKHLNRTELLYPILQQLSLQTRSNYYIPTVSVTGAVKVPAEYPLTLNAKVADLIAASGGLTDSAYITRAELSRVVKHAENRNGVEVHHLPLNLQSVLVNEQDSNIALQNKDRLNVFKIQNWQKQREITLEGEVRFPGTYVVQQGETLSNVLARAGGLTDSAFAFGAVFTREQVKEKETIQFAKLLEQLKTDVAAKALTATGMQIAPTDALLMIKEIGNVKPVGRLVIDLEQAMAANPLFDVMVEDGDKLFIPRINRDISVLGEVQHPSTHRYDNRLSLEQYLKLAGGERKRADADRVYVIRADGSVMVPNNGWFAVSSNQLKPGDTIVVPVDTEYKDTISLWTQITQIFYQSAVALAALNSF